MTARRIFSYAPNVAKVARMLELGTVREGWVSESRHTNPLKNLALQIWGVHSTPRRRPHFQCSSTPSLSMYSVVCSIFFFFSCFSFFRAFLPQLVIFVSLSSTPHKIVVEWGKRERERGTERTMHCKRDEEQEGNGPIDLRRQGPWKMTERCCKSIFWSHKLAVFLIKFA